MPLARGHDYSDDDQVGRLHTRDPVALFRKDAEAAGLIRPGDPIDQNMVDFAYRIVERCASIGDGYDDPAEDTSAGAHIRALLGDV